MEVKIFLLLLIGWSSGQDTHLWLDDIDLTTLIDTEGCNVTKSCFLIPDTCLITGNCRASVSVFVTPDGRYQFDMMAVNSVYVAVGLSDDARMGDDSVVECVHDDTSSLRGVSAYVSYNYGTSNNRIDSDAAKNGVNLLNGSYSLGVVRCTFIRDVATTPEDVVYDLSKTPYHLLLVSGSKANSFGIDFHDREYTGSKNGRLLGDVGMFYAERGDADVEELFEKTPVTEVKDYSYELFEKTPVTEVKDYSYELFEKTPVTEVKDYSYELFECHFQDASYGVDYYGSSEENAYGKISTKDCNVTKSCFLIPDSCLTSGDCRAAVSVHVTDGVQFEFELQALDGAYVAVALSQDSRMGDDSVVECVHNKETGRVEAFVSWNKGHKNKRIDTPISKKGIKLIDGAYENGVISCTFTRKAVTSVKGTTFDLVNDEYHLLLAAGKTIKDNGMGHHDLAVSGSHNKRNLSDIGMFTHHHDNKDTGPWPSVIRV